METRERWAKLVEGWKASGLTAEKYGAQVGVLGKRLHWWSWQLGRQAKLAPARRPRALPSKTTTVAPLTFVEMTAKHIEPLEVVLTNGLRVRVGDGFTQATLARVLDVLERR